MEAYESLSKIEQMVVGVYAWISNLCMNMSGQTLVPFFQWEDGEAILVLVNTVYEELIIAGVGMLIIYFLADLNKTLFMAGSNMTMQHMFNPMIKLLAGYVVITKGGSIIGYFLSFNNWWVTWVGEDLGINMFGGGNEGEMEQVCEMVNNAGIVGASFCLIPMILMLVVTVVVSIILIYKALIWKIELGFRLSLAPISLGDIFDGKNGNAVRYLKKILSMVLYAGGVIMVFKLGNALYMTLSTDVTGATSGFLTGWMDWFNINPDGVFHDILVYANGTNPLVTLITLLPNLLLALIIPLAELGCMKAVKQICDDALG